ncbi:histone H1 [Tripterygium wilfordii]|uniref:Histone H1 n=1 Tax=Tripterygium wilfordii TaxID=458696 RepID=A0A7J7CPN4_TRIWF|nr:histone H1 [Tripterygium wilfordii]KAF5735968.1 histone H1 [Tripterygium wilfordii]
MAATEEVQVTAVEQPPAVEEVKPAEKPVKEKKTKAPKEKKPKQAKTASHPPYFQMIKEALLALNEKSGSSPYAIAKHMEEKHKAVLPANFRKMLTLQLKNSAARGKLVKIKASFKLSEAGKKDKPATRKPRTDATKKPKAAKTTDAKKKTEITTRTAKKAGPTRPKKSAPAKPKQPKSIKSPAAKKAKRATATA